MEAKARVSARDDMFGRLGDRETGNGSERRKQRARASGRSRGAGGRLAVRKAPIANLELESAVSEPAKARDLRGKRAGMMPALQRSEPPPKDLTFEKVSYIGSGRVGHPKI
jgi:hypothetical protein